MILYNNKEECCGCTACEQVCHTSAIKMEVDDEGFFYPDIANDLCVECGACKRVCQIHSDYKPFHSAPKYIYGAKNRNRSLLTKSSSGGVFIELAKYIISKNGIVYGVAYSESFEVIHTKAESIEECYSFMGSKYVQSNLNNVFKEIREELKLNRLVLFSGTPCQVWGLKKFLNNKTDNLITIDLICHQVPSPLMFKEYVSYLQKKIGASVVGVNMKDKTIGWGHQKSRVYFSNGTELFNHKLSNLWDKLYYSLLITRPVCHHCKFTNFQRVGDITIGDYVFVEKHFPDFFDKEGVSLVFVNNDKGEDAFSNIKALFEIQETNESLCIQPMLEHPFDANSKRAQFWGAYKKKGFDFVIKKYLSQNKIDNLIRKIRSIKQRLSNI